MPQCTLNIIPGFVKNNDGEKENIREGWNNNRFFSIVSMMLDIWNQMVTIKRCFATFIPQRFQFSIEFIQFYQKFDVSIASATLCMKPYQQTNIFCWNSGWKMKCHWQLYWNIHKAERWAFKSGFQLLKQLKRLLQYALLHFCEQTNSELFRLF